MRILQQYVLKELLVDFCYALSVITAVFFIGAAAKALYQLQELSVLLVLQLFPLFIPMSLPFTVPLSMLIATVLTFGRLTADREILAIRTSGIHLFRVTMPAIFLGLLLSSGVYVLNDRVVPYCQYRRLSIEKDILERFFASLDRGVKNLSLPAFELSWSSRDPSGRVNELLLIERGDNGEILQQIMARTGTIQVRRDENKLDFALQDMRFVYDSTKRRAPTRLKRDRPRIFASPETSPAPENLSLSLSATSPLASDAAAQDPARPRESLLKTGTNDLVLLTYDLDEAFEGTKARRRKRDRTTESLWKVYAEAPSNKDRLEILTEIHKRGSNSLACFVFALVGTPLGILSRHGNRIVAFFISFLVVCIAYYPLAMFGEAIATSGKVPPVVAMWSANAVLFAIGGILLRHVFRR